MFSRAGHDAGREYPLRPIVGIGVVLLRPGPEVLLIRRGRAPALGEWSFPGGAQRLGETAEEAARRELLEETGLRAGALGLIAHVDSLDRDPDGRLRYHYTILDFCGRWQGDAARAGGDARDVAWAGFDRFEALALWPEARRVAALAAARLQLAS